MTSSKEALLLENHLIKKHQPRFNVKLRDDKQYLVLRLVDPKPAADADGEAPPKRDVFPRVEVVRNIRDDGANYFGPYHSATSRARDAAHAQPPLPAPHLHRPRARDARPAVPAVPDQALLGPVRDRRAARGVRRAGRGREDVPRRQERRARARACARAWSARAEREDFEVAAVLRDSIAAVERTLAKQHVVQDDFVDQDVWGLYREADSVEVVVLFVRARQARRAARVPAEGPGAARRRGDRRAPPAVLRDRHVHPRRGRRRRRARGRRRARRVARRRARQKVQDRRAAARHRGRASSSSRTATPRRPPRRARSKDADAEALLAKVAKRLGAAAAAAPHRVLRHRAHPGHRHGRRRW